MMRFDFLLLLVTVCSCVSTEDGRTCKESYVRASIYEAYCSDDYDTNVSIQINEGRMEVTCSEESAWSNFEYYVPTNHYETINKVSIVQCSWPNASLHEIFREVLNPGQWSLSFCYGGNFRPSLSKFDLKEVADVQELTLCRNGLRELAVNLFEDFAYLRKLDLSSNNIGGLDREIFSRVTNLTSLDLSDNNMTSIDEMLFQDLTRLEHLNLMRNHLTSLHANTFGSLLNLSYLNLADNHLGTLPKDLFVSLYNLTSINISGNQLSAINNEMFARNTELRSIIFCNNRGNLSQSLELLTFLYIFPNLEILELTRDNLKILPENIFYRNVYLKRLNLSGNAMETLRKDVFEGLENLEILDISANRLYNVHPDTFSPLVSLTELYLERNNLTTIHLIPESLEILNAAYNQISNFSADFIHLEYYVLSLRVLRLSNNLLGILEENVFFFLTQLLGLCDHLEEIYLDHNEIGTSQLGISDLSVNDHTDLRVVDLSNNRLRKFQLPDSIATVESATIDVRHNMINAITVLPSAYSCTGRNVYTASDVFVRFGDNPIICDCGTYDFFKALDSTRSANSRLCYRIDVDNLTCSDPPWMKGVPVLDIDSKNFTCRRKTSLADCPENCECWWRPDDRTHLLNCSHRNLTEAPRLPNGSSKRPIELNLEGNHLTKLPSLNESGYELVTKLFLSHNNISNVSFDLVPPELKVLQLEHNKLTSFDARTMNAIKNAKHLYNLTLFDNPWDCGREMREFLAYIDQKYSTRTTVLPGKQCLDQPSAQNRVRRRKFFSSHSNPASSVAEEK